MEALMADCVQRSLRMFLHRNAIFMCERLCADFPSEKNLQLLATCYIQNGQPYAAYHILKGTQMAQSRYLYALSCFQMNLLREAEVALCPANDSNSEIPSGAAGHYLLGLIYRYTDRRVNAVNQFVQALTMDPLLWSAYEELCILGAAEDVHVYFSDSAINRIHSQYPTGFSCQNIQVNREDCKMPSTSVNVSDETSPRQWKQLNTNNYKEIHCNSHGGHPINCQSGISLYNTPSPTLTQLSGVVPPPPCRNLLPNPTITAVDGPTRFNTNNAAQAPRRKFMDEGKLRKVSGRLFSDSVPRRSTRLAGEAPTNMNVNASLPGVNGTSMSSTKILGGFSPSSKMGSIALRAVSSRKGQSCTTETLEEDSSIGPSASMSNLGDCKCVEQQKGNSQNGNVVTLGSRSTGGTLELLSLMRILGEAYRLSCKYKCQEALEVYLKLSSRQYNTGWVLSQVGKAHFELIDYYEADRAFGLARRISPYAFEGMDIYSTVLYRCILFQGVVVCVVKAFDHLKEDMKLSYLVQELITVDRLSPQAWCAMGNCYSLQKDHETALKNLQRAVHLDPRCTYAHTLCGHEYAALEDFENAIKCYQSALKVDDGHYNSWYGLGTVYLRQEKFEFAEHHFRKALHINPYSSVLMCYLGRALHPLKRNEEALLMFEKAILADPKNPLPMFEKANLLVNLERYDEALEVLEQLKENSPRESTVYSLLGKAYKKKNMHERAMFYYGLALDHKPPPSDVASIKSAIEKLFLPDDLVETI